MSHIRCERSHSEGMAIDTMADIKYQHGATQTVKPRSFKKRRRRNRSNFFYLLESAGKISEESDTTDEALRDYMDNIAAQQSDSDLDINMARRLSSLRCQLTNLTNEPYLLADKVESDSCTEINYQKKRRKRKRKQKKMCGGNSVNTNSNNSPTVTLQPSLLKLPSMVNQTQFNAPHYNAGKHVVLKAHRSRINDDDFLADVENTGSCSEYAVSGVPSKQSLKQTSPWSYNNHDLAMELCHDGMDSDHDIMSISDHFNTHETESSALSSSSEDDLFTNDEGQFGDDELEESCYETDARRHGRSHSDEEDQKFHKLYRETLEYLKSKPFFQDDDKADNGRQSGQNFLRPEMGPSAMLEINKRIKKFLQDPTKLELRLAHVKRKDKDELSQLAALYSLHCNMEDSPRRGIVVLIKTRNTSKPEQSALCHFLGRPFREMQESQTGGPGIDVKRRRKTPPGISGYVGETALPLSEHNIGNQMLQSMGWIPGQGLGPSCSGIREPVKAFKRSGRKGFGHAYRRSHESKI